MRFAIQKNPSRLASRGARAGRKPGSVFCGHLSGTGVATGLKRPIPQVLSGRASPSCLLGLAPGGVCRAPACCQARRWALTPPFHPCPHRGRPRPLAVSSLWHFPSGCPAQPLAGTLPYGARTFLTRRFGPPGATAPLPWGTHHSKCPRIDLATPPAPSAPATSQGPRPPPPQLLHAPVVPPGHQKPLHPPPHPLHRVQVRAVPGQVGHLQPTLPPPPRRLPKGPGPVKGRVVQEHHPTHPLPRHLPAQPLQVGHHLPRPAPPLQKPVPQDPAPRGSLSRCATAFTRPDLPQDRGTRTASPFLAQA